jgi:hypothetical protein
MLQDSDKTEASCALYVKVGTFDQLEQSKVCILTVTQSGTVMLNIQHYMILSLSVM